MAWKVATVVAKVGAAEYRAETYGDRGKVHTALRRWECDGTGLERTALFGYSRTLAVQARARITSRAVADAHRLACGDVEAVKLALAGIASAHGEVPCPRLDEEALRAELAKLEHDLSPLRRC